MKQILSKNKKIIFQNQPMSCPICDKSNLIEKYKYDKRNEKFQDSNEYINYNDKILTCLDCDLSFNSSTTVENLDNYYSKMNMATI